MSEGTGPHANHDVAKPEVTSPNLNVRHKTESYERKRRSQQEETNASAVIEEDMTAAGYVTNPKYSGNT